LCALRLDRQWYALRSTLPEDWGDIRLVLRVDDPLHAARANALLAPLFSGRHGNEIRFTCSRAAGPGEDALRRLLGRLDEEAIAGTLEIASVAESERQPRGSDTPEIPAAIVAPPAPGRHIRGERLAPQWDAALEALPPDWSDILAEVEITSSDLLERTALLMGPLNPARDGERFAFRFRCARTFGYGAAPGMVERCLERVDAEGIRGQFTLLRALSDTKPVYTQGPVWYVGGKTT
jgi:hypothetical protein